MTAYRFSYHRVVRPTETEPHLRFKNEPLLDIGLLNKKNGKIAKVMTYIDTGSQWCLFNKQYAFELGIKNYDSVKPHIFGGVGGPNANTAYFHDITLLVYTEPNNLNQATAIRVDTKVGFCSKDFGFGGILGVCGFLDHFIFTANIPQCYFMLENIL
ncbi:MAG: hypothetical protein A2Z88_05720 [Omnitrophica WOR_2 bacterium GWA2_47_8]|nr:MAG: hypothetical protein A2Z88_05720 [Omnitrophica WOR_2 bacterium GWA2_47_8]